MIRQGTTHREQRLATVLLIPAVLALLLFYYLPVGQSSVYSFFDLQFSLELSSESFAGLENYRAAFTSPEFWRALVFTTGFSIVAVALDLTLGMLFALASFWVHRSLRWLLRAIIIIPWAIPNVIQASIWRWMFNTDVGLIGDLFVRLGLT